MKYAIVIREGAQVDVREILEYYRSISPKLSKLFKMRFKEAMSHISKTEKGFQIRYREVRMIPLRQFPYLIHYFLDEKNRHIVILAVVHSHKKPKDYSKR